MRLAGRCGSAVNSGRLAHVDGLRALAVILVVVHHATTHSALAAHGYAGLARLTAEGAHGVDLFFVLSGFCLSYPVLKKMLQTGAARFDVCRYFAGRFVRIVPPYYAAIALFATMPGMAIPWTDLVKQALFLDWHTQLLNGSFWTLCVEFRWYFLFPLALLLWIRAPRAFIAGALAVCAAYALTRLRALDAGVLLPFLLGIVAAELFLRRPAWLRYAWIGVPLFAIAGLLLEPSLTVGTAYGQEVPIFFEQTNPGWQLAMFALVLTVGYDDNLARLFSIKPLVWTGIVSYSVYLVHEPLVTWLDGRINAPLPVLAATSLVAATGAGALFWFFFERPWCAGALKPWALARLNPVLIRAFRALELPASVEFANGPRPAQAPTPSPVRSVA